MTSPVLSFPAGFYWGTTTSAYAVEGENSNTNWAIWEKEAGHIQDGSQAGDACGWWKGYWKDDLDKAANGGQNAHRLVLEWSRIQPTLDQWDEDALATYKAILLGMFERDITPVVALYHFTEPIWFSQLGGWENENSIRLFSYYVRKVVNAFKDFVSTWCTFNDPNLYLFNSYFEGVFPPGKHGLDIGYIVGKNIIRAHSVAYRAIHEIQPQANVGISIHFRYIYPASRFSLFDRWVARTRHKIFNDTLSTVFKNGRLDFLYIKSEIPEAANSLDFIGINYFTSEAVKFIFNRHGISSKRIQPAKKHLSENRLITHDPEGLTKALTWASQFNLPILITENGFEESKDNFRPVYILEHLYQVWKAIQNKIPVKGYFYYSLIDSFEWNYGWIPQYGLWKINHQTQERIQRTSAELLAAIGIENGIPDGLVNNFAPHLMNLFFPPNNQDSKTPVQDTVK